MAEEKTRPDCDGVYCGVFGSVCFGCPEREPCEEKRIEIDNIVRKYGTSKILPHLHGASIICYAEEHFGMKEGVDG